MVVEDKEKDMDAVIIIVVYGLCLLLPFWLMGLMWWFWFWAGLAVLLGVFEYIAHKKTGQTLTRKFKVWRKTNPEKQWWIFGGMVLFWTYLIYHLFFE